MIKYIYGTMNAGKTVQLIRTYELYKHKNMDPIVIKPAIDDREGKQSGWGFTKSRLMDKKIPAFYYKNITDICRLHGKIFMFDEAQFMSKKDVRYAVAVADSLGIDVIAYGLKTDVNGNLFNGASAWLAMADEVREIENICEISGCNCKANFHNRYIDGVRDNSNKSVAIDKGNISYKAVCYKHWMEK